MYNRGKSTKEKMLYRILRYGAPLQTADGNFIAGSKKAFAIIFYFQIRKMETALPEDPG